MRTDTRQDRGFWGTHHRLVVRGVPARVVATVARRPRGLCRPGLSRTGASSRLSSLPRTRTDQCASRAHSAQAVRLDRRVAPFLALAPSPSIRCALPSDLSPSPSTLHSPSPLATRLTLPPHTRPHRRRPQAVDPRTRAHVPPPGGALGACARGAVGGAPWCREGVVGAAGGSARGQGEGEEGRREEGSQGEAVWVRSRGRDCRGGREGRWACRDDSVRLQL